MRFVAFWQYLCWQAIAVGFCGRATVLGFNNLTLLGKSSLLFFPRSCAMVMKPSLCFLYSAVFFIHLRISKQLSETSSFQFDVGQFIRRRCRRLVPPYVLAIVLTILLDTIG